MATQFDPYQIQPDWAGQGSGVVTAWQRALANLNLQKNTTLQKYGFNATGDFAGSGNLTAAAHHQGDAPGVLSQDGTYGSTNLGGGLNAVNGISDFAAMDNKTGQGGFRDELTAEANALDAANNGPSRGFSGGLSNQAKAAAQRAVTASQNQFTQGYNQFAGGFNIAGQNSQTEANSGLSSILSDQATWGANESLWQSTLPTYTAGVSGGGSTPIGATGTHQPNNAYAVTPQGAYNRTGAETPMTSGVFKGTAKPATKAIPARGGHATQIK